MGYYYADTKPFTIKYPLLYLIVALSILFVGGNDVSQMVSPDGKTTAVFFLNSSKHLVCQLFEAGDPLTDPVQLKVAMQNGLSDAVILGFKEVSYRRGTEAGSTYTQAIYEMNSEEGPFLLQVRQSDGLLAYRVVDDPGSHTTSNVNLVAMSDVSGGWMVLPVKREVAVVE